MYHAHFGLERGLFDEGIASDTAVFRNSKHDRLTAQLELALASASSSIVLHGAAGVGKTTLTSHALRASSTRLALAWLNGMPTNGTELLELILIELGIDTLRTTRMERLQLWRQFQAEMRATDSRLLIVAERAEDLSAEVLHTLDQLTAPDAAGNPGANLILLGHAGIHAHLAAPLLDSLRQRIRLRAELEPFTEAELQDYLRHQTARAGGQFEHIFAPGTVAALYRYTNGVARLVNTLCESALGVAAVQHHKQLTPELVTQTAVSLLGLAEPTPAARTLTSAPPAPPVETSDATRAAAATPSPAIVERRSQPRIAAVPPPPLPRALEPKSAPPPTTDAPSQAPPSTATPAARPQYAAMEYDGSATDVADVAIADFPILTDAVEPPASAPAPKQPVAAAAKSTAPAPQAPPVPLPASRASAPALPAAAAAKPVQKPGSRVETAYTTNRPAPSPMPTPPAPTAPVMTPLPHMAAAAKPNAPAASAPASADPQADDELRQTQTMRAIAGAKSIDDISEIDAETLFSDAELDLVSAALASAADWPDDDEPAAPVPAPARPVAATATKPAPARPEGAKPAKSPRSQPEAVKIAPVAEEDPFDLFGLGDDAPLELIDDSELPPNDHGRKSATR